MTAVYKYVSAGLAVCCLIAAGLYISERFENARLSADNKMLKLSLDSFIARAGVQEKQIKNLNDQLAENAALCEKRLQARRAVAEIFKPVKNVPENKARSGETSEEPPAETAEKAREKDCESVIDFNESVRTVRYFNGLFGLRQAGRDSDR